MMMKAIKSIRIWVLLFVAIAFMGCNRNNNSLKINFLRSNKNNTSTLKIVNFKVSSADSIYEHYKLPAYHPPGYNIILDSLPDGEYDIAFFDLYGNEKIKRVHLNGARAGTVSIVMDSIDATAFFGKTPMANLKNNSFYKIDKVQGCVASFHDGYEVEKKSDNIFIKTTNQKAHLLTKPEIEKIKQFEAELLSINGKGICGGTGIAQYSIITDKDTVRFFDNTCNWDGWNYTIRPILNSRFKE
ncbi:hypothetical protein OGH69_17560 [Flavobacterium sp. MFBS3-15]|uniref:hypothetical protein n=1 Tax=Flavobacterium sp. MFBS3-15 TaxID=2989816 RepID=UPI0022363930|nr:hypothetical protein [Flavobacterium sp. MFBS3-15]MCW4470784.1 hypothetical protein [Flavobacterium sp. MFBS3-15]